MTDRKCATCEWWQGEKRKPPRFGRCYGAPPAVLRDQQGQNNVQVRPQTQADEWCGLHKAKAADVEESSGA